MSDAEGEDRVGRVWMSIGTNDLCCAIAKACTSLKPCDRR